jgi:hypothetical protein
MARPQFARLRQVCPHIWMVPTCHCLGVREREIPRMSQLNTYDLSLKELAGIALPNGTGTGSAVRQSGPTLVWSLLPDLDMVVLNIFAAHGTIFWNFSQYGQFTFSEQRACWPFMKQERMEQTHAVLRGVIKKAGMPKRSAFSCKALGLWMHTAEFCPRAVPTSWRFMHLRHMSIVLPTADKDAVQGHFEEQWRCFGADAVMDCSEQYDMVDFADLKGTLHEKLLHQNIASTNADERSWLYDEVLKYQTCESLAQLGRSLDIRFAARGLFDIVPVPTRFSPFVDADRYAEVLRFRARLAISVCPLPQIEKLALRVSKTELHVGEYPGTLQNELSTLFANKLEKYREITAFELPSQKVIATEER